MRYWDWFGDGSLWVADIGLACCALEFEAAIDAKPVELAHSDELPTGPVAVVVSGTITNTLAHPVRATIEGLHHRCSGLVSVVSFGACTATGGPYWDAAAVTKGLDQLVDVDVFVPGCPPPPGALDDALAQVREATC